jgi:hypothetical protein
MHKHGKIVNGSRKHIFWHIQTVPLLIVKKFLEFPNWSDDWKIASTV